MAVKYLLVFLGSFLVDLFPIPLPPAFTVMIFLQAKYDLNIWLVILCGVPGSILGRLLLTLYAPYVSNKIFTKDKNDDVEYLGKKMKQKGWKGHLFVLAYSLMPLPTTPLFLGAGMARLKPYYIIPAFTIGKIVSDTTAVLIGDYAVKNTSDILQGMLSWKSISGFALGLLLVFALIFFDWRSLLLEKKFRLKFKVLNHGGQKLAGNAKTTGNGEK
jgi:membrane protein DedA with SNARE-associated domain